MAQDEAVRFAERVIALVDAGKKSATYKLATLLALIDVVAENTGASGPPTELDARDVALRVVELYWPQTAVYGVDAAGIERVLRQSSHNDIPAKLAAWRRDHTLGPGSSFDDARMVDPDGWGRLEAQLVPTVIRMPLAKLQRFGDGRNAAEDRFIYDFGWVDEVSIAAVNRPDFDATIRLRPQVGEWLVQLAPLLRPFAQVKWAQLVARQNEDLVDAHQLNDFLFGATRIRLDRIRQPLAELQDGRCFYCRSAMRTVEVDHFLPWSRHPDNLLDNLVAAHPACNNAKSASVAGTVHLAVWFRRSQDERVQQVATATGWPRQPARTRGAVNATYLWLPSGTRLWIRGSDYEVLDPERVRECVTTAET